MQHENTTPEPILRLLEELESAIAALKRPRTGAVSGEAAGGLSPVEFRTRMARLDLAPEDVARVCHVDTETVRGWLWGATPIPDWAGVVLTMLAMLAPPARRRVFQSGRPGAQRVHPFSRIEEL